MLVQEATRSSKIVIAVIYKSKKPLEAPTDSPNHCARVCQPSIGNSSQTAEVVFVSAPSNGVLSSLMFK